MARQWHHADWSDEHLDDGTPPACSVPAHERPLPHHAPQLGFWPAERGSVRWEGFVDLQGSFPGFTAWGGFAENVRLHLTDRYLLVEDGTAHGFGLPLGWISTSMTMAGAGGATLGADGRFRIRFMDGSHMRGFALRVRGGRFRFGLQRRMQQLAEALYDAELFHQDEDDRYLYPPEIDLSVSWEHAEQYENERVIWRGRAVAPVGWALDHAPCDVWLTTESVIWGTGAGSCIYRLPVSEIVETVPADLPGRSPIPGIFVTVYVGEIGRVDLPFMFDCGNSIPRNVQDRGAFMVALRSRGIPLGIPEHPPQPWLPAPPELPSVPTEAPVTTPRPNTAINRRYGRLAAILPPEAKPQPSKVEAPTDEPAREPNSSDVADLLRQPVSALLGGEREQDVRSIWPPAVPGMRSRLALTEDGSQTNRGVVVPFPSPSSSDSDVPAAAAASSTSATAVESAAVTESAAETVSGLLSEATSVTAMIQRAVIHGPELVADQAEAHVHRPAEQPDLPATPAVMPSIAALVQAETPPHADVTATQPADTGATDSAPELAALERYEAAVTRSLAAVQAAIEARLGGQAGTETPELVPAAEKATALAALDRAVAAGLLPEDAASTRRERIERASEAAIRLHSFLHFLDCGYFDLDTLREKRDEIAKELLQRAEPTR